MADFILNCISNMTSQMTVIEKRMFTMYGEKKTACNQLYIQFRDSFKEQTMLYCFDLIDKFGVNTHFHIAEIASFLGVTSARASQLIKQLDGKGFVKKNSDRSYSFICK